MRTLWEGRGVSRRAALRALGGLGASLATGLFAPGAPGTAMAQGNLAALQPEEKVEATMKRLFGNRHIKEDSSVIKLELPLIAENGGVVPITVEVQSPMTPENHLKHLYIISDRNRRPLNASFSLTPEMGAAVIGTNLRLNATGDVRAVAEMSDGTLLMARRGIKVTIGGCGG